MYNMKFPKHRNPIITSCTECGQSVHRLHSVCSLLPSNQAEGDMISTTLWFPMCAPTSLEVDNSALTLVFSYFPVTGSSEGQIPNSAGYMARSIKWHRWSISTVPQDMQGPSGRNIRATMFL